MFFPCASSRCTVHPEGTFTTTGADCLPFEETRLPGDLVIVDVVHDETAYHNIRVGVILQVSTDCGAGLHK